MSRLSAVLETERIVPSGEADRDEWTAGLFFQAYGVTFGIRATDPALLDRVPLYLPYGWRPAQRTKLARLYSLRVELDSGASELFVVYRDEDEVARLEELDAALDALEVDIRLELVERARHRIFVHAGAVGWRGRAILVPGTSGTGKTTLVAELVRAGATYYSDEYAVLDRRGRIHPFATPLHVRKEGNWKQERQTVEALGGRSGGKPLPVALVVATSYKPGGRSQLEVLSPARAVLELLKSSGTARSRPLDALTTLERVVSGARVFQGERGEAKEFASRLLDMLESDV